MRVFQFTWPDEFKLSPSKPIRVRRSWGIAVTIALVGLFFIGIWIDARMRAAPESGFSVLIAGTALVVWAIWLFRNGFDVSLTPGSIRVRRLGLLSGQTFDEPFNAYRGVVQTTYLYRKPVAIRGRRRYSGRRGRSFLPSMEDVTVQRIELVHQQRRWTVPIYQGFHDHLPRDAWEQYAKDFGLPLLIEDGDRLIERAPEDIDKSIKELVAEGKLDGPTTAGPPPWSFTVNSTDDLIDVTIRRPAVGWGWVGFASIIPVLMFYSALTADNTLYFRALAVIAALSAPAVYMAFVRRHVLIYRKQIDWAIKYPFFKRKGTGAIAIEDIEQVSLRKISGDRKMSILLSSDRASLSVARGVTAGHLEWLRDLIIKAILTA